MGIVAALVSAPPGLLAAVPDKSQPVGFRTAQPGLCVHGGPGGPTSKLPHTAGHHDNEVALPGPGSPAGREVGAPGERSAFRGQPAASEDQSGGLKLLIYLYQLKNTPAGSQ